jgi:cell division protein FtsW
VARAGPAGAALRRWRGFTRGLEAKGGAEASQPGVALFCTVLALSTLGLLVQLSHAATTLPRDVFAHEFRGLIAHRLLGLLLLLGAFRIGPVGVRRFLPHLTLLCLIALLLVFVPGASQVANGSHRWIRLPLVGQTIQPSELARVVIVIWVADRCVRLGAGVQQLWRGYLPMLGFGLGLFALIVIQPDLGGSLLFLLCFVSTMWVGGARPSHVFGSLAAAGGAGLLFAVSTLAYVRERISVWVGASGNAQVERTLEAIASGNWFGVGFGQGLWRNSGLQYMQTDYAFSLVGEEFGLVGCLLVVALVLAFAWFSFRLVLSIEDRFSALVAFGLLTSVALQAMLHLQVVTGLAPPKGMNLPFVSAGGSSLLASCLAVGLALGAARTPSRPS